VKAGFEPGQSNSRMPLLTTCPYLSINELLIFGLALERTQQLKWRYLSGDLEIRVMPEGWDGLDGFLKFSWRKMLGKRGSVGIVWDFQGLFVSITTFLGSQLFPELGCSAGEGSPGPHGLSRATERQSPPLPSL